MHLKRLSITLEANLHKRLKLYAANADVTMNDVVIESLHEYLLKHENVAPDSETKT